MNRSLFVVVVTVVVFATATPRTVAAQGLSGLDLSGLEKGVTVVFIMGGIGAAVWIVEDAICIARPGRESCFWWGGMGLVFGTFTVIVAPVMAANEPDRRAMDLGFGAVGLVIGTLSGIALWRMAGDDSYTKSAQSRWSVLPTLVTTRDSSAPGVVLVGQW